MSSFYVCLLFDRSWFGSCSSPQGFKDVLSSTVKNSWTAIHEHLPKPFCAKYGTFQCQPLQIILSHICLKNVAIIIRHHTYKSWCSIIAHIKIQCKKQKLHQFTPMPILDAKGIHRLHFSCFAHRVERRKSYPSSTAHQRPSQLFCHRPLSLHPILQIVTVIKQQILSNYQSVSNAMSLRQNGAFKCLCQ